MTAHAVHPGGSLRRRLAVTVVLTTALVVAVAGAVAWLAAAKLRRQGAEAALNAYAIAAIPRLVARQWLAQRDGRMLPELLPQSLPDDTDLWRALVTKDGRVLAHNLAQEPDRAWLATLPAPGSKPVRLTHPTFGPLLVLVETIDLRPLALRRPEGQRRDGDNGERPALREGDTAGRRLAERLAVRNEQRNEALLAWIEQIDPRLVMIHPLGEIEAELRRQAWVLVTMWLLACGLVTAVVWTITGRVLAPVRRMTEAIAVITPGTDDTVAVAGLPQELQPVQARLNDLLARVDAVLTREQQTTANIAHELRTPLAGLRAKLELALTGERDPTEVAKLCRDGMATLTLLQGLIDNLLLLTRLEAGQEQPKVSAIEVAELLAGAWALHQPAALTRRITLERRLEPALSLITDPDKLRAILSNLLSNAVAYATPNSMISVAGHEQGDGRIRLTVTNEGATISQKDAERVFEPFWRGDKTRTVERGHCGLGLALVRRLVTVLGGTVSVSVKDGRFTVLLVLPGDLR